MTRKKITFYSFVENGNSKSTELELYNVFNTNKDKVEQKAVVCSWQNLKYLLLQHLCLYEPGIAVSALC